MTQWGDSKSLAARDSSFDSNRPSEVRAADIFSADIDTTTGLPVKPLDKEEALQRILQVLQAVDALDDCFNVFDDDRNGVVDVRELETVAEQVGDLGRSLVQEMHMYIDEKEAQGIDVNGVDRVAFYSHFLGALGIDGDNAVRHLTQPPQLRPAPPARRLLTPARSPARAQSNASGDSDFQPDWEADLAAEIDEAANLDPSRASRAVRALPAPRARPGVLSRAWRPPAPAGHERAPAGHERQREAVAAELVSAPFDAGSHLALVAGQARCLPACRPHRLRTTSRLTCGRRGARSPQERERARPGCGGCRRELVAAAPAAAVTGRVCYRPLLYDRG